MENKDVRVTEAMILTAIAAIAQEVQLENGDYGEDVVTVTQEDIQNFASKKLAALEHKKEKARENAAKKRAEGDKLGKVVESVLTNEFQTADEVLAAVLEVWDGDEADATRQKVIYRLSNLVKLEKAEKTDVKVDKRTIKAYKVVEH